MENSGSSLAERATRAPLEPRVRQRPLTMARRRRMVGGTATALGSVVVLATAPGLSSLGWVALGLAVLLGAYLGMLVHLRNTVSVREVRAAEPLACDWSSSPYLIDRWAITRFLWAGLAGSLLQVVAALTQRMVERRLIGDGSGQAWLDRSLRLQEHLRRQSVRVLFVSATAAAGATAVGSMTSIAAASPLSMATPLPMSASSSGGPLALTYTVAAGDTLTTIADRFATTAPALATLNHLSNPNLILAGQVLSLPGTGAGSSPVAPPPGGSGGPTYTVVVGDTLGSIADRFATTPSALATLNHLANPNLILAGQVLSLPGTGAGSSPVAPSPGGSGSSGGPTYTVVVGDTLGSIADRFATTTSALATLNHLSNPNLILAGQTLMLDSPGSGVTRAPTTASPATPAPTVSTAPTAPTGTSPSGASTAVSVALAQVGKPYVWAGAGPDDFDCSGLVMYAWEAAGVDLPHYSVSQYEDTTRISAGQLEPGDLVFYGGVGPGEPQHVDLYIGGDQVVAADNAGTDVRVESVDFAGTPSAYGQVV